MWGNIKQQLLVITTLGSSVLVSGFDRVTGSPEFGFALRQRAETMNVSKKRQAPECQNLDKPQRTLYGALA